MSTKSIKRILLMFAILFQVLAVTEIADYNGPLIIANTEKSVFDRDVDALVAKHAKVNRSPAVHKE